MATKLCRTSRYAAAIVWYKKYGPMIFFVDMVAHKMILVNAMMIEQKYGFFPPPKSLNLV